MAAEMVILATSERLKEMDWTRNIEICELVTRDPGYMPLIFLLLDAAQTALGGVSGRYPQYYTAYYDLVVGIHLSSGVQFPQHRHVMLPEESTPQNQAKRSPQESHFHNCENIEKQVTTQLMPDSRYHIGTDNMSIHRYGPREKRKGRWRSRGGRRKEKGRSGNNRGRRRRKKKKEQEKKSSSSVQILLQGATDEFTLDLVEQCSFQKQRIMHLVMTAR
ncbi:hypothetical protein BHM03_00025643 [Ensete ventricosum]|nr:hypothetical protein BHM03_00025643 [Ensete ventricosum]